jgi:FMN-dependent oxidoreductase (nitrilotriacetate monooxygenase family)
MFHLGWFAFEGVQGWGTPDYDPSYAWNRAEQHKAMAKKLEAACLDFVLLEDLSAVPDVFGGSVKTYVELAAQTPKFDPSVLATLMADATTHIGIVPTLTTTFYPPYLLARLASTMDHMSGGRMGWNIVTSSSEQAARNYGFESLPEHDARYDVADEYLDLCKQLWNSWEEGAIVGDHENEVFADHTKVKRVDFAGKHFRSRGPLTVPYSPQGWPVLAQAGVSPRGKRFAAKHAELILTQSSDPVQLKAYRDEVRSLAAEQGRNPDEVKVLNMNFPRVFANQEEVDEYRRWLKNVPDNIITRWLALVSAITNVDLASYDRDKPLPDDINTNGSKGTLDWLRSGNATPRQIALRMGRFTEKQTLVGTAEQVADEMEEIMDFVGGDGFLVAGPLAPKYVARITDRLVPVLQKRGLMRTSYSGKTFRENLLAF